MYTYVDYSCTVDIMVNLVKYTAVTPHWDTQTNVLFVYSLNPFFIQWYMWGMQGMRHTASEHFPSKFNPFIKLGLEWFENSGWCLTFEGWMAVAIFKLY